MGLNIEAAGVGAIGNASVGAAGGNTGALITAGVPATPQGVTSGANASAVITIVGVAGQRVRLLHLAYGYTAAAPAAGASLVTVTDGSVSLPFTGPASTAETSVALPAGGLQFTVGASVTVTIAAGGAAAVGVVTTGSVIA